MKKNILLVSCLFFVLITNSQTTQISIGNSGVTESFFDNKIDKSDGGTINVGYLNDPSSGNGYDLLIVKLNSNHQLVWQKTVANPGDDIFFKVIVCGNGDYVAVGETFVLGVRKAIVYRFNSTDGSIIWSQISTNATEGELFWNVIETANNNLAIVGAANFASGQTNSFIVLLNSSGSNIWSYVSTTFLADEFRSIAQLPNSNLIVAGFYNPLGANYYATILELDETTAAIVSQNTYNINASVPGGIINNSLWPTDIFIRNNTVLIGYYAFQGYTSALTHCIYTYDQTTKDLSGNIYYQPTEGNATGYSFYPLTENDFLISQSYSTPAVQVAVSRIKNGSVQFDRKINNTVNTISGMDVDVPNTKCVFSGNYNNFGSLDAYNLFSSTSIPASALPCDIVDINTLTLQTSDLSATPQSVISLSASPALGNISPTAIDPGYIIGNVCGFIVPITLIDFKGTYNTATGSSLLLWSTATELNSKVFMIERSNDGGSSFSTIGSVNSRGTSNTVMQYQYPDKNPPNGINLYRLKEIDLDGKFQYSNIVSIEVKRREGVIYSLYPVPAKNYSFLYSSETTTKMVDISIIDALGKIIKQQRSYIDNTQPAKLDLSSISPGIYFVRIVSAKNQSTTIKLSVN